MAAVIWIDALFISHRIHKLCLGLHSFAISSCRAGLCLRIPEVAPCPFAINIAGLAILYLVAASSALETCAVSPHGL